MKNQLIIGLTGQAGSGKSTVSTWLRDNHGFVILPFAGPLKRMLLTLGVPEGKMHGQAKEEPLDLLCGKSPRQAMQLLGKEWGREMIGIRLWKDAWLAEAKKHNRIVADDVRFPNEACAIHGLGGIVLNIVRPGMKTIASPHASEVAIKPENIDRTIVNRAGALDATLTEVDAIIGSAFGVSALQRDMFADAAE